MRQRFAPAKINLGLHVLRRRPDGYRDIATVFLPIGWADVLTAEPASSLSLTTSDPSLPADSGNLVWRAAEALARAAGIKPRARLHLEKRVPYGAGLGSGSSDAAAALLLLRDLWEVDVPSDTLHRIAGALGADVPFFLDGAPALGTGTGADLVPLAGSDGQSYAFPFALCVAVPPVHVATGQAYDLIVPEEAGRPDLAELVAANDPARWRESLRNDFQEPVERLHPEIALARQGLEEAGALYAALSGSGSAVFGVFEQERDAADAAQRLRASGCRTWTQPGSAPTAPKRR
jgi:4-diphosphocytidyl-2-C-methyl-D-erythritol kinase